MRRDWSDDPLGRVYGAAVSGDPIALAAIELMPDLTEAAGITKSKKKKRAAAQGAVMRNVRWHEQVSALRQGDTLKAARRVAAAGYDEAQFLRDLQRAGQYQGYYLRPGHE